MTILQNWRQFNKIGDNLTKLATIKQNWQHIPMDQLNSLITQGKHLQYQLLLSVHILVTCAHVVLQFSLQLLF